MALIKEIELDNGIKVSYHRVVSIHKITNNQNIIEIGSYINKEKRLEELETTEYTEDGSNNIFIHTRILNTEYNADIDITNVYEYLKTLDIFSDAIDDM